MKWIKRYRRVSAIVLMLVPHLSALAGHPIGGEEIAPVVNGIGDLAASVLVAWSKLASVSEAQTKP
jgi:hypothetical protein